jgi:hypothetical protein
MSLEDKQFDKEPTSIKSKFGKDQEDESTRISKWQIYEDACKDFESHKQKLRESWDESKEIEKLQSKINYTKTKIHSMALRFETSYTVNLDPQFKDMLKPPQ